MTLYDSPPTGFQPKFDATGVYLECEGAVLWLQRHSQKPEGGKWCVAGGKKTPNETLVECAQRETQEETGVELENLTHAGTFYVRYAAYDFVYHVFRAPLVRRPKINLKTDEHTQMRWLTPKDALSLDLIEDEDIVLKRVYGL